MSDPQSWLLGLRLKIQYSIIVNKISPTKPEQIYWQHLFIFLPASFFRQAVKCIWTIFCHCVMSCIYSVAMMLLFNQ